MHPVIFAVCVLSLVALARADCLTPYCYGGAVCCGLQGVCVDQAGNRGVDPLGVNNTCLCDDHFKPPSCQERRKYGYYAVPLTVVTGLLGFDCFYLGRTGEGIAKLIFGLPVMIAIAFGIALVGYTIAARTGDMVSMTSIGIAGCCTASMMLVGGVLYLVYAILIISGNLTDAAGYSLYWGFQ